LHLFIGGGGTYQRFLNIHYTKSYIYSLFRWQFSS